MKCVLRLFSLLNSLLTMLHFGSERQFLYCRNCGLMINVVKIMFATLTVTAIIVPALPVPRQLSIRDADIILSPIGQGIFQIKQ